ncbi:hypothetical protein BC830DRAFT_45328 [Chytriomyces sp. MP71]|nr:hypothetical protein BC830DRAFT_45328 [Chytriomyces sp. MP71]
MEPRMEREERDPPSLPSLISSQGEGMQLTPSASADSLCGEGRSGRKGRRSPDGGDAGAPGPSRGGSGGAIEDDAAYADADDEGGETETDTATSETASALVHPRTRASVVHHNADNADTEEDEGEEDASVAVAMGERPSKHSLVAHALARLASAQSLASAGSTLGHSQLNHADFAFLSAQHHTLEAVGLADAPTHHHHGHRSNSLSTSIPIPVPLPHNAHSYHPQHRSHSFPSSTAVKRVRFKDPEVSFVITHAVTNTWIEDAHLSSDSETDLAEFTSPALPIGTASSILDDEDCDTEKENRDILSDTEETNTARGEPSSPAAIPIVPRLRILRRRPVTTHSASPGSPSGGSPNKAHIIDELELLRSKNLLKPRVSLLTASDANANDMTSASPTPGSHDPLVLHMPTTALGDRPDSRTPKKVTGILKVRTNPPVSGNESDGGGSGDVRRVRSQVKSPRGSSSTLKLFGVLTNPPPSPAGAAEAPLSTGGFQRKIARPSSTGTLTGKPKISKTTFQQSSITLKFMDKVRK